MFIPNQLTRSCFFQYFVAFDISNSSCFVKWCVSLLFCFVLFLLQVFKSPNTTNHKNSHANVSALCSLDSPCYRWHWGLLLYSQEIDNSSLLQLVLQDVKVPRR